MKNSPKAIQKVSKAVVPWFPGSSKTISKPMQEIV